MEEKKAEYDFFGMGIRHAAMYIENLKETEESIRINFGEDAALQFSSGVATHIPAYLSINGSKDISINQDGTVKKQLENCFF